MGVIWAVAGRRGLPAAGLPVGALQALEVVGGLVVVKLLDLPVEGRDGVSAEQVRDVVGEVLVDAVLAQAGFHCRVDGAWDVVVDGEGAVAWGVASAVVDVGADGVVAGLGDARDAPPSHAVVGGCGQLCGAVYQAALGGGAVVHALRNGAPAHVDVGESAFEDWRSGGHGQHDRRQYCKLVVHVATFIDITALECHLLHKKRRK
jgi:hypothetical protein